MSPRRSLVAVVALVAALLAVGAVRAAPEADRALARKAYEKGHGDYQAGRYSDAAAAFELAHSLDPSPVLLFNIAQAHRKGGRSDQAVEFYRRYLHASPGAENAAEVRQRIWELDRSLETPPGLAATDRLHAMPSSGGDAPLPPAHGSLPESSVSAAPATPHPRRARLALGMGPALPSFSGKQPAPSEPLSFGAHLDAALGTDLVGARVELGLTVLYARLGYETTEPTPAARTQRSSHLPALLLGAGAEVPLGARLHLGARAGGGVLWWSGLGANNPIATGGRALDAQAMFALRAAAHLRLELPNRLLFGTTAAYVHGVPGNQFREASSLSRVALWQLLLEAGYGF